MPNLEEPHYFTPTSPMDKATWQKHFVSRYTQPGIGNDQFSGGTTKDHSRIADPGNDVPQLPQPTIDAPLPAAVEAIRRVIAGIREPLPAQAVKESVELNESYGKFYRSPHPHQWEHDYSTGKTSHWSGQVNVGTLKHEGKVIGKYEGFEHPSTRHQSHIRVTHVPSGKSKQFSATRAGTEHAKDWVLQQHGVKPPIKESVELKQPTEPVDHEFNPGDHVHLGFGAKGGAGFHGTVHHVDGDTIHITSKYDPNKMYKGPVKFCSKLNEDEVADDQTVSKFSGNEVKRQLETLAIQAAEMYAEIEETKVFSNDVQTALQQAVEALGTVSAAVNNNIGVSDDEETGNEEDEDQDEKDPKDPDNDGDDDTTDDPEKNPDAEEDEKEGNTPDKVKSAEDDKKKDKDSKKDGKKKPPFVKESWIATRVKLVAEGKK